MSQGEYTIEVTGLSPNATEKDLYDFFSFSGSIDHVEIVSSGDYACTAYVMYKDAYSQEMAVLLGPQQRSNLVSDAEEAVAMAQEVVKTMLAEGFVLGKDVLSQAKAFEESHRVSATAAAKVSELNQKIGLTDKIGAGVEAAKSVDEKYHISETTKSAVSATGRAASAAANTVVNSSHFAKGALWMSDALNGAANAAADLGNRGVNH